VSFNNFLGIVRGDYNILETGSQMLLINVSNLTADIQQNQNQMTAVADYEQNLKNKIWDWKRINGGN
jgi:hypothetical protein